MRKIYFAPTMDVYAMSVESGYAQSGVKSPDGFGFNNSGFEEVEAD